MRRAAICIFLSDKKQLEKVDLCFVILKIEHFLQFLIGFGGLCNCHRVICFFHRLAPFGFGFGMVVGGGASAPARLLCGAFKFVHRSDAPGVILFIKGNQNIKQLVGEFCAMHSDMKCDVVFAEDFKKSSPHFFI